MGPLILGYAGLELLCPRILGRIRQGRGLVGALILSGMVLGLLGLSLPCWGTVALMLVLPLLLDLASWVLGLLGLSLPRWGTVALMLVLPLLLDLASCLLDQAENDQIDRLGRQVQRAELLSLFIMGVNLLEMEFLLGSSAVSALGGERPDRPAGPPGAAGRAAVAVHYGGQPVGDGVFAGVLGGVRPGQRGLFWGGGHRSGRSGAGLCRTPDTEKERVRWNF